MNKITISGFAQGGGSFYLEYKDRQNSEIIRVFRLEDTESSPVWCSVDTKFSNGQREHFSEEMPFPRRNPFLPRALYLQPLEYLAAREYAETIVKTNPGEFKVDDEIEKRFEYDIKKSLLSELNGIIKQKKN
jgi:hypothetical protein